MARCIASGGFLILLSTVGTGGVTVGLAQTLQQESAIRAGREIAIESCTSCHIATGHQDFQPLDKDVAPSFIAIANRPGMTEDAIFRLIAETHRDRKREDLFLGSIAYISDEEAREVAEYILTQKY